MKFPIEVRDTDLQPMLAQFVDITGPEPWERRFEWLANEVSENRYMEGWLRERCGLELTLNEALVNGSLSTNAPFRIQTMEHYDLMAFIAGVTRTFQQLGSAGKYRLRGALLDGLKTDKGLLSVQHEITTAVHLMSRGFDVEFNDIESGGGVDFLARKEGIEIEVECKMFSADLGRKIHRRRSATLFKALEDVVNQTYRAATRGLLVRITIPDRLTPSPVQHLGIQHTLATGLLAGTMVQSEHCAVEVRDFSVTHSPFNLKDPRQLSQSALKQFAATLTGRPNTTLMSVFDPGKRAVIIMVESARPDAVLQGMRRQLRDAAVVQFSKSRPAFLAAQLHDLTDDQLLNVGQSDFSSRDKASSLQVMTSDLLQSESRAHVHTIVYRAHGRLFPEEGVVGSSGVTYLMKNALHPLADDPRYAVFSDPSRPKNRVVFGA